MYVVRVHNDEAVMYRAFRHLPSAKVWASEKDADSVDSLIDILEAVDTDDHLEALSRARRGATRIVVRAEALAVPPPVLGAGDIEFGRAAAMRTF